MDIITIIHLPVAPYYFCGLTCLGINFARQILPHEVPLPISTPCSLQTNSSTTRIAALVFERSVFIFFRIGPEFLPNPYGTVHK